MNRRVRVRTWGGQVVDAYALRRFLGFVLCQYGVRESLDGQPPYRHYVKAKGYPAWRVL